jgi:branched-chain amino acid transport system substrate-binding protein
MVLRNGTALIIAIGLLCTDVGGAQTVSSGSQSYKIGVTYPLTGPFAAISRDMLTGLELGVADVNRKGGVKGHRLQLAVEDSQGTAQGGVAAMRKLAQVDGVQVVLTAFTGVVTAQIPLADQLKVPFVVPMEAAGVAGRGQYSFSHAPTSPVVMQHIRDYWKAARYKRIFVLVPNNAYGQIVAPLWRAIAEDAGAEFDSASVDLGSPDFRGVATKAKDSKADAIGIDGQGSTVEGSIVRALRETGVTVPLFTPSNNFRTAGWRESAGPYSEGMFLTGANLDLTIPSARSFVREFREKTGHEPSYAPGETYDSVIMIATAIARGGYSGESIRNELASMQGVPSVFGGTITMRSDHYTDFTQINVWHVVHGSLVKAPLPH